MKEEKNKTALIFVHVEQQSTQDPMMAYRMLRYTIHILDHYLSLEREKHPNRKRHFLPLVVPLLFYTGHKPYSEPVNIFDLFGDNKALAASIMLTECKVIDASQISDETLRQHRLYGLMAMLYKHSQDRDIEAFLESITDWFRSMMTDTKFDHYVSGMLHFLAEKTRFKEGKPLEHWVKYRLKDEKTCEDFMTYTEYWMAEGIKKEKLEGLEEGCKEGVSKSKREDALKIISLTGDVMLVSQVTGLSENELRLLTADTA